MSKAYKLSTWILEISGKDIIGRKYLKTLNLLTLLTYIRSYIVSISFHIIIMYLNGCKRKIIFSFTINRSK